MFVGKAKGQCYKTLCVCVCVCVRVCVVKTFFHFKLSLFVSGKLFQPSLTNTLAYYENSNVTDKRVI
jgi:hypothetical protein